MTKMADARAALKRMTDVQAWLQSMPEDRDIITSCMIGAAQANNSIDVSKQDTQNMIEWLLPMFTKIIFAQFLVRGFVTMQFPTGGDNPTVQLTAAGLEWLRSNPPLDKAHTLVCNMLSEGLLPPRELPE